MNRRRLGCYFAVLLPSVGGCNEPCEPTLCLDGYCESLTVTWPMVETSTSSRDKPSTLVVARYSLPAGVTSDEQVKLSIETPCACVRFERAPIFGTNIAGKKPDTCHYEPALEVPFVLPPGGACRLTVTAQIANDQRSLTIQGSEAECEKVNCVSDLKCEDDLDTTASEHSTSGWYSLANADQSRRLTMARD